MKKIMPKVPTRKEKGYKMELHLKEKQAILNTLNEEQQQPTKNYKGPQFVVACPGAGK